MIKLKKLIQMLESN